MQYVAAPTLADAIFPRFETDKRALAWARELALMAGFAATVALLAQIQVRLPWTTVPITGQTFGVLVAGGALGMRRGAGALTIYALAGMFLLPVFTPGNATTSGTWDLHFILPWRGNEGVIWHLSSGGYIVGFVLSAALVGFLAERRWDRGQWVHLAMLLGTALVYLPGLLWLGYLIATDWTAPGGSQPLSELISGSDTLDKTLRGGLYPFIVGDLMKLLAAAMVLPGAWLAVERLRGRHGQANGRAVEGVRTPENPGCKLAV
jgi:biotin transport system substrate-specific component